MAGLFSWMESWVDFFVKNKGQVMSKTTVTIEIEDGDVKVSGDSGPDEFASQESISQVSMRLDEINRWKGVVRDLYDLCDSGIRPLDESISKPSYFYKRRIEYVMDQRNLKF